ncbi:MAG: hypothetical protein BWY94_02492 [Actinobacteria bacterium ADurb.BinA094]|nr:MAG: hypothetical protein BWY94_02492 [Actinobacteria bacterium ADurb.BinA094]
MQEIWYENVPAVAFAYARGLEVYNTRDWDGWINMPAGNGGVLNYWTYLGLQPKTAAEASSGASTGIIVAVVAAVAVVVVIAVVLARRGSRRRRAVED